MQNRVMWNTLGVSISAITEQTSHKYSSFVRARAWVYIPPTVPAIILVFTQIHLSSLTSFAVIVNQTYPKYELIWKLQTGQGKGNKEKKCIKNKILEKAPYFFQTFDRATVSIRLGSFSKWSLKHVYSGRPVPDLEDKPSTAKPLWGKKKTLFIDQLSVDQAASELWEEGPRENASEATNIATSLHHFNPF